MLTPPFLPILTSILPNSIQKQIQNAVVGHVKKIHEVQYLSTTTAAFKYLRVLLNKKRFVFTLLYS